MLFQSVARYRRTCLPVSGTRTTLTPRRHASARRLCKRGASAWRRLRVSALHGSVARARERGRTSSSRAERR